MISNDSQLLHAHRSPVQAADCLTCSFVVRRERCTRAAHVGVEFDGPYVRVICDRALPFGRRHIQDAVIMLVDVMFVVVVVIIMVVIVIVMVVVVVIVVFVRTHSGQCRRDEQQSEEGR